MLFYHDQFSIIRYIITKPHVNTTQSRQISFQTEVVQKRRRVQTKQSKICMQMNLFIESRGFSPTGAECNFRFTVCNGMRFVLLFYILL